MDEGNSTKEKVKALVEELRVEELLIVQKDEQLQMTNQKVKNVAAKAVQAFQLTKEYNTVLFIWYYKGFKFLKWYLVNHNLGVDLENLDFELIDKEMEADEVAQATTAVTEGNVPEPREDTLRPASGDDVPVA